MSLDMNPFPDGAGGPDERIPVTVMLTPTQAARLEGLTAELRALDPSIDDNDVADAVFDAIRAERFYVLTHPAFTPLVRTRMEDILEGRSPTFIPPR